MSLYEVSPLMSINNINDALKSNRFIHFRNGLYNITSPLNVYSNTRIIMEPGVILKRAANVPIFTSNLVASAKGYSAVNNVYIEGGVLDGDVSKTSFGNIMQFMHSKDIFLRNIIFKDIKGSHAIEINSSKNVHIENCIFRGYIPNPDGAYREAIQIDFANFSALQITKVKTSACYDDTHCKNIFIEKCIFEESDKYPAPINAIGTHSATASDKKHENIQILNNIAKGRGVYEGYGLFASIINMRDVLIEGNQLSEYMRLARVSVPTKFYKTDGSTVKIPSTDLGCENVKFKNNLFKKSDATNHKCIGIYVRSDTDGIFHKNISIENNFFDATNLPKSGKYVLLIEDTNGIKVTDNTIETTATKPISITKCTKIINRDNDII